MPCADATAPVNIAGNTDDTCTLKCDYRFNYPLTNLTAMNEGEYLKLVPETSATPPAIFNADKFMVVEARIYRPSLHTYGGRHSDAELLVLHANVSGGRDLIVSVPLDSDGPIGEGSMLLAGVLAEAGGGAATEGTGTGQIQLPTFNFGKLIPLKPFFSYQGTLPYSPCSGSYNYVVFAKRYGLGISADTKDILARIITANTYAVHEGTSGLFYNPSGAKRATSIGDEIYIECKPTGHTGETQVEISDESMFDELGKKFPQMDKVVAFLKSILIALIIGYIFYRVFRKMIGPAPVQKGGGGAPRSRLGS